MKPQSSTIRTSKLTSSIFASFVLLLALPGTGTANDVVAEVKNFGTALEFQPVVEFEQLILTVTGPCNFLFREVYEGGTPLFKLNEETIDGIYTYSLKVIPRIDSSILEVLAKARKLDDNSEVNQLCRDGKLPGDPATQSEGFLVAEGKIAFEPGTSDNKDATEGPVDFDTIPLKDGGDIPFKDFVILDDLIVDGSACIGFDCVNGESFSFDTIRLKENNLRIKFDDTSTAASFPANDWQLTANASANGGASKFSIDDISGSRTPFTVEANARSHSLYVDDGGRIGNRTSTPSTEIHTIDGDTPTLRLQQDGSSGFAPQTWDVAGNETNFFIRDVSNGSTLPFRIRPGAPTSSIFVDVDGDVGIGTASPGTLSDTAGTEASLHVRRTDGEASILVEEATGTAGFRYMLDLSNVAGGGLAFRLTNGGTGIDFNNTGGEFRINHDDGDGFELALNADGDLSIDGNVITSNCPAGCGPDYVFEPDYELMPLSDLGTFIAENKHLPNVPPAVEMETGGINMTQLQLRLLEKVEELTLYTLEQQSRIDSMSEENADLKKRLAAVENGLGSAR